jgi:hypothetical protein
MAEEETLITEEENTEDTVITKDDDENVQDTQETKEDVEDKGDDNVEEPKDGDKDTDKGKAEGAPDKYEDFNLPENFQIDEALLEQALPVFKELNLSQDQAQKLIDLQTKNAEQLVEADQKQWEDTRKGWVKEAKDDKEIGGKDFNANVATARAAVKEFADEGFKEMLNITGVGDHPEMVRFLFRIGKAIEDDKILMGRGKDAPRDPAKTLFPEMN